MLRTKRFVLFIVCHAISIDWHATDLVDTDRQCITQREGAHPGCPTALVVSALVRETL